MELAAGDFVKMNLQKLRQLNAFYLTVRRTGPLCRLQQRLTTETMNLSTVVDRGSRVQYIVREYVFLRFLKLHLKNAKT